MNECSLISWPGFAEILLSWKALLYIGIPAILTQLLFPISNTFLTRIASDLGEATVAAFGVGKRIESLAMISFMALASILIPLIGQNYGAGKNDRIIKANKFSIRFAIIWDTTTWGVLAFLSGSIAWAFADNSLIQDFINQFFWIVHSGFAFHGISQLISASCNALHRPFHSTLINIMRLFLILIPLVYLGSHLWNTAGFYFGIAAGNFVTGVAAWFWYRSSIIHLISE